MKFSFLFMFVLLFSCGQSSNPEDLYHKIYYQYGTDPLPGSFSPLDGSYKPANLSSKEITSSGKQYFPMDIKTQNLAFDFNVTTSIASVTSTVQFTMAETGVPYFQFLITPVAVTLDGASVSLTSLTDPDGQGQNYRGLENVINQGESHEMVVTYVLPSTAVTFSSGGVKFLTSMTDLAPSNYFETWAPVTFEDDAFEMTMNLKIENGTATHQLFTNGQVNQLSSTEWTIQFPDYFTKSSFYLHLTNSALVSSSFSYQGKEKIIPITVYAPTTDLVNSAVAILPDLFREFEDDYGPYAHDSFTAYMHASGGGMEYVGATITSLGALDHELFHSWFARGVMPADGRSGWIDEGLASWRDYYYFQASSILSRDPTNLANYSPFRESTTGNCYRDGRQLAAELDRVFLRFGGLKPVLKLFFERYKKNVITNEEFWNFLSLATGINVDALFERYTLSQNVLTPAPASLTAEPTKHPTPLTEKEIYQLR